MDTIESTVFITPEVLIYQIPPLKSNLGHRAGDWDVENPMWKGRLKVVEMEKENDKQLQCELRLEDNESGELFASAPYSSEGNGVEPVRDSSRFFAIKVVNGDGRHAILGMGFGDRNEAFEFNIALQDFRKHTMPVVPSSEPKKDFSLKEGQSIHINLGKNSTVSSTSISNQNQHQIVGQKPESESIPVLIPPPPAPPSHFSTSKDSSSRSDPFDDDFGDFVG